MDTGLDDYGDSWKPPTGVTTHAGTPITDELDFIVSPPPEIGDLLTCYTSLVRSKEPMGVVSRLLISIAGSAAISGAIGWLVFFLSKSDLTIGVIAAVILFPILLLVIYLMTGFKAVVSFVGKKGAARYTIKGSRSSAAREDLLIFEDELDLFTGQTQQYTNGVYTGTTYFFRWQDPARKTVMNLSGSYHSKEGNPKPKDPFHFARMAEIAWSMFLLDAMQAELEKHGSVQFQVNKKDAVRVGPGFMEFEFGGKQERVDGEQLKHISIAGGTFSFKTSDAKWFSSKGKFSFNYANMANARCFLLVLQHLLGVTFQ